MSEENSIVALVTATPAIVLLDTGKRDDLYAHIKREIAEFTPDLDTVKGRDAIKSLAFKIVRTKTAIDAAGKQLNEDARAKIGVVDAARRDARETLDAMAAEVRQPLTDWENAEELRVSQCNNILKRFEAAAQVSIDDTSETVAVRIAEVEAKTLSPGLFGGGLATAEHERQCAISSLKSALARLEREEADRAELEKLRAEAAEREARETAAREAEERAAAEKRAVEQAEADRLAKEKADAERIAKAEQDAADKARREAEAAHAEALKIERDRAEKAEREAQAERDRVAREEAEQAARDANAAHRKRIMSAAKTAIMDLGIAELQAKAVVLAIVANSIPAVSLRF